MIYDADLIKAKTDPEKNALAKLDKSLRETMKLISLKKGDLIIIDNKRSIHSRTKFNAYFDGNDR